MNAYNDYLRQVHEDFNEVGMFLIYEMFTSETFQQHIPGWKCREYGEAVAKNAEGHRKAEKVFVFVCNNDMVITALRLPVKEGKVSPKAMRFIIVRERGVLLKDCEMVTLGSDGGMSDWPKGFGDEYSNMSLDLLR